MRNVGCERRPSSVLLDSGINTTKNTRTALSGQGSCRCLNNRACIVTARAQRIGPAPRGGVLSLQSVEVEEGRRQADGQVGGGHLVLLDGCSDIAQEVEERLQDLPVLVGQEHDGGLDRLETLVLGHICATPALPPSTQ